MNETLEGSGTALAGELAVTEEDVLIGPESWRFPVGSG